MPPTDHHEEPEVSPADMSGTHPFDHRSRRRFAWLKFLFVGVLLGLQLFIGLLWWALAPAQFDEPITITVNSGESVSQVVARVAASGVVRSESLLYLATQIFHADETIETGTYKFYPDSTLLAVATYLMRTTPADELVAVTFPEGITVADMADIAAATLPNITVNTFTSHPLAIEGELLPETYFVPEDYSTDDLLTLLRESQESVLMEYSNEIDSSTFTERDILTIASILEREANDEASMRMVAGIFLNRLELGMPLQADATIEYVLETPLGQLPPGQLAKNLRELDSPYNTYLYTGLPPTPIGNPGVQAIQAVLNPIPSDYFFYITGNDGAFYYAETYEQHLVNIERHLR